ncbi:MAG TPA: FHA domain-containing protein [Candidatus Sulfotelmatobacter sp.]|nr:FHA domain-containing protein [Candidatus Sulfotelmatobacter sp.]
MAKLVILNQGMTGRTLELNVERTTVGRVEENTFQIADASVSSRHAEILLHGTDIVIKDLNSTNGTYINGEKISEAPLKLGQTLRFGQVELRIDDGKPVNTQQAPAVAAASPAPAPAPAPKRSEGGTMVMTRGVSLSDLEESGTRQGGFDTNKVFSKKKNKANMYFIIGGVVLLIVIVVLIIVALNAVKSTGQP